VSLVKPTLGRTERDERFVDEAHMEPLKWGVLASLTPGLIPRSCIADGYTRRIYIPNPPLANTQTVRWIW